MRKKAQFTTEQARAMGERIGIEGATSLFEVEQLRMGMDVELESPDGFYDLIRA